MKKYGLISKSIHSKKISILNNYLVKYNNLINGDFSADIPNTKWCIDITKINTEEGNLYFCAIIDLFDRSIVSYNFHTNETSRLVSNTVEGAIKNINITSSLPLILHSDQGLQFSSKQYAHLLKDNNINGSMSKKATPNDNAVIESFFASLKKECIYRKIYKSKIDAIKDIEFYIFFYNNYRIQLKTRSTPIKLRQTALTS
jgi:transposase InsO family protein